jgi:NAD(P)-dependent dehydrogenase (short-subunit alcohol dehydrogenase family)
LLPAFRAQHSGHILNISSVAGFAGFPSLSAYSSSKAALDAFSEVLAEEVAPFGVRVHIIAPGYFPTNFFTSAKAAHETADPERSTGAYTTREQGYGLVDNLHPAHLASRQIGDLEKAAERMYEVVAGTGVAQGLMDHREWVRVPLGPDAGNRIKTKATVISATVDAYEPIWKSTNMDDAQLKERFGI